MWLNQCQNICLTVWLFFFFFFWAERDCQQPRKFCAMCLGNICQARPWTSPNARGCFKLACAPRVSRLQESGFLCACVSKKEVNILQNWQAPEPLMCCIPTWNCWKRTLCIEKAKKNQKKNPNDIKLRCTLFTVLTYERPTIAFNNAYPVALC